MEVVRAAALRTRAFLDFQIGKSRITNVRVFRGKTRKQLWEEKLAKARALLPRNKVLRLDKGKDSSKRYRARLRAAGVSFVQKPS